MAESSKITWASGEICSHTNKRAAGPSPSHLSRTLVSSWEELGEQIAALGPCGCWALRVGPALGAPTLVAAWSSLGHAPPCPQAALIGLLRAGPALPCCLRAGGGAEDHSVQGERGP